jgi:energy-converting hydrogenase Eha subunit H
MALIINDVQNKAKLIIQQGSDLSIVFDLVNFTATLVGATGRGKIKRKVGGTTEASFTCAVDSGAKTMTATLLAADSTGIVLDASTTAKREITTMAYDIELVFADNVVVRLLWGECDIIPEVTTA